jgi:hypothetical protein
MDEVRRIGAFLNALRKHWGPLVSGAVIGIVGYGVQVLSGEDIADERTGVVRHDPLLPWWWFGIAIAIALFIACYLTWRDAHLSLVAAGLTAPPRVFTTATVDELADLPRGHSSLHVKNVIAPHLGTWLRATGQVQDVSKRDWGKRHYHVRVTVPDDHIWSNRTNLFIECTDEVQGARAATLSIGQFVDVVGRINEIEAHGITLTEGELDRIEVPDDYKAKRAEDEAQKSLWASIGENVGKPPPSPKRKRKKK